MEDEAARLESEHPALQAPFPWFGGKSRVAHLVWSRFGRVPVYVEPFFGSGAVLLGRPTAPGIETVNDRDGMLANAWRAIQHDPEETAYWADRPVNENDLHAIHAYLVPRRADLTARLEGDPDYFDAKLAGWWLWGICCWIGSGWCRGNGPWHVEDGRLVNGGTGGVWRQRPPLGDAGQGVKRQLPHLGDAGQGVNRQRPPLGNAGQGVKRQLPHLGDAGRGVNRQLPPLGDAGRGGIYDWFESLSRRLRWVRVCCGDWTRVLGPSSTTRLGLCGVLLDPPYSLDVRDDVYAVDEAGIAARVRTWAIAHGDDPMMRIALCGYRGEYAMPASWETVGWKAPGGYGSRGEGRGRDNAVREVVYFSPHCLKPVRLQPSLFGEEVAYD